jgi:flavin reductase (DIM6/NTAB) family NADH-FMN oxidoreductase RutF
MTTAAPSLRRLTPQAAVLLLAAAVAWVVTVGRAGAMRGMTVRWAWACLPSSACGR